jgi:hypothetical protein
MSVHLYKFVNLYERVHLHKFVHVYECAFV